MNDGQTTAAASEGDGSPVKVGELLAGKYRIERVLGRGGMGVVVAAMHVHLLQRVALKFLLGIDAGSLGERFLREARAAVRLKNGHIAKVLDVGTLETGAPYIVMEYLEGRSLGEVVREDGPLPITDVVDYVLQVCEGLAEAHALGIVHRDLKPDNLFLTRRPDGHALVKILDFGISKTIDPVMAGAALTQTHEVVGSPLYMSPEQLRSARSADYRSDIWALGIVLYELSTGKVPFLADTYPQLILRVVEEEPPPPTQARADLPAGLELVILRCLEKDPSKRFPDVAALAAALAPFAPEALRDMPQRVRALLGSGSGATLLSDPSASAAATGPKVLTGSSWGGTRRVLKSRFGSPAVLGAVLAVAAVAVAMALLRTPSIPSSAPQPSFATTAPPDPLLQVPAATASTAPPVIAAPNMAASASAPSPSPKHVAASRPATSATTTLVRDAGDLVFERK